MFKEENFIHVSEHICGPIMMYFINQYGMYKVQS